MGLSCMDPIMHGFSINTVQYNLRAEPVDAEPQTYRMGCKWVFSHIPNLCVVKGSNVYIKENSIRLTHSHALKACPLPTGVL